MLSLPLIGGRTSQLHDRLTPRGERVHRDAKTLCRAHLVPARYCPGPTTNNIEVPIAVVRVSPPADIRPRQVPSGPGRSPSRIEETFPAGRPGTTASRRAVR